MIALARVISRWFDGRVYGNCLRSIKSVFSYFPTTRRWLGRSVLLTKTLLPRAFETDCSSSIGGLTPPKDYKRRAWSRIDRQCTTAPFYRRGAEKTCSFAGCTKKKKKHPHRLVASGSLLAAFKRVWRLKGEFLNSRWYHISLLFAIRLMPNVIEIRKMCADELTSFLNNRNIIRRYSLIFLSFICLFIILVS